MLKIGICDDCRGQIELVKGYIERSREGLSYSIFSSIEPERFLLKAMEIEPQLVFLDIDMAEMNGIELGERIKAFRKETLVVYITGHEKYALEAFEVHAFHYLIKPVTYEKFEKVFKEAVAEISRHQQSQGEHRTFALQVRSGSERIPYQDILYFEKVGHKIRIHTHSGTKDYYGRMLDLMTLLDADAFFQCHQGYVVNVSKILAYRDKTLTLTDNCIVPVSRAYSGEMKELLTRRLFSKEARA